jgi:hypothetical protein
MSEPNTGGLEDAARSRAHEGAPGIRRPRGRWIVLAIAAAVVLLRSVVFVFWSESYFDSDQAVMGLMAKHLSEGRAFPVFIYGQNYMLAVEAWLAAPLFLMFGASVTALKLPLLALNLTVALLLVRVLEREVGLRPWLAAAPAVFFVLPPPGTAAHLLEAGGGNLEPFVYILLLWMARHRAALCGLVFGVGFVNREFTLYGLIALLAIEAADGTLFTREGIRRRLAMFRVAAEVWLVVQWLRLYSSAAGPGTTPANIVSTTNNLVELTHRICLDVHTLGAGVVRLFTIHFPELFGTAVYPLGAFAIQSSISQGMPGSSWLLALAMLLAIVRIVMRLAAERRVPPPCEFCVYLTLVGALAVAGYVAGRCGQVDFITMRYELLGVFGAVGLGAWYLHAERSRVLTAVWIVLIAGWTIVSAAPHARLLAEYVRHPPVGAKRLIIRSLEAEQIRYATADYWKAYYITFLTNERIIVDSSDFNRIVLYHRLLEQHRSESVRISRTPCDGGRRMMVDVYFCPP